MFAIDETGPVCGARRDIKDPLEGLGLEEFYYCPRRQGPRWMDDEPGARDCLRAYELGGL